MVFLPYSDAELKDSGTTTIFGDGHRAVSMWLSADVDVVIGRCRCGCRPMRVNNLGGGATEVGGKAWKSNHPFIGD